MLVRSKTIFTFFALLLVRLGTFSRVVFTKWSRCITFKICFGKLGKHLLLQDFAWNFFSWWSPTSSQCSQPLPSFCKDMGEPCRRPTFIKPDMASSSALLCTTLIISSVSIFRLAGFEMGLMLICLFLNNPEAQVHFGASKTKNSSKRPNSP